MQNKLILSIFSAAFCIACNNSVPFHEDSGSIFHTLYIIKYQSPTILSTKIDAEFQKFSLSLNPFNPNSLISKVNRNEHVEVDDWFITVFNKAQEVSERSEGAFDCTVSPLINLWGFGFRNADSVTQQKIDSIKEFVGYSKIRLDGRKVLKDDPRVELNFSAIAKGFAADVIAALLQREGVDNYMINIGGEVAVAGKNPKGGCWNIGINRPEDDSTSLNNNIMDKTIHLCNKSGLASSGNYRNFYILNGKKYSHTIDTHTGYPSQKDILSATIIAPDCMTADAYATAFMAMGIDRACRMADSIPEIDYFLISEDEKGFKIISKNQ